MNPWLMKLSTAHSDFTKTQWFIFGRLSGAGDNDSVYSHLRDFMWICSPKAEAETQLQMEAVAVLWWWSWSLKAKAKTKQRYYSSLKAVVRLPGQGIPVNSAKAVFFTCHPHTNYIANPSNLGLNNLCFNACSANFIQNLLTFDSACHCIHIIDLREWG